MTRPRFKLRSALIAITVVGLILALCARSERFRRRAVYHQARSYIGATKTTCTVGGKVMALYVPTNEGWWHYRMRYRMEEAARRPWRPFDPEPLPLDLPRPQAAGFAE